MGVTVSGSGQAYVGFSPGYRAHKFFDDIVVENDSQVFDLTEPDPLDQPWLFTEHLAPVGTYYDANVPETLDLAERAKLSVQGLTGFLDPNNNYSTYCHSYFNANPAYMTRHWGGGISPNWGKAIEALVLARNMCGSTLNLEIEHSSIEGMIQYADINDPLPTPLSRIMLAMMSLYQLTGEAEILTYLDNFAQAHIDLATVQNDYAWYYDGPGDFNSTTLGIQGYWLQAFVHGTAARTMCRWYEIDQNQSDLEFAGKLANFTTKAQYWQAEAKPKVVVDSEQGQFSGHIHSVALASPGSECSARRALPAT